eukprot:TRINITY_DN25899_c0_g2_i1.p1 TRINITY_DN25899_c0_g2~~TRINITY_DN25899_c0_g2_i1.p1  ORF type:complete len:441 (-),score=61.26 TRINITY_DN25899_c0_g2_i1:32-1354(-)
MVAMGSASECKEDNAEDDDDSAFVASLAVARKKLADSEDELLEVYAALAAAEKKVQEARATMAKLDPNFSLCTETVAAGVGYGAVGYVPAGRHAMPISQTAGQKEGADRANDCAGIGHSSHDEVRLRVTTVGGRCGAGASSEFGQSKPCSSSSLMARASEEGAIPEVSESNGDSSTIPLQQDPTVQNFWDRAGWLVMLLMFQSTSSIILEHFDVLIRRHPVVIYFLTMLVGAGGNAGSQSTVLVVRRLALAGVRPGKDGQDESNRISVRRIVGGEAFVGARLACVLFAACVFRCVLFGVPKAEMLAICLSMFCIVFTSTLLGAALPVLLSRAKLDPAHASAAIQVIMDISGVGLTCVVSCLVLGMQVNAEDSLVKAVRRSQVAPTWGGPRAVHELALTTTPGASAVQTSWLSSSAVPSLMQSVQLLAGGMRHTAHHGHTR